MFRKNEVKGVSAILRSLKERDVLALALTITNNLIIPESKEEAIKAICVYSPNAMSVLKRRKIKKQVLFKYLHNVGRFVAPDADKDVMIRAILDYWHNEYNWNTDSDSKETEEAVRREARRKAARREATIREATIRETRTTTTTTIREAILREVTTSETGAIRKTTAMATNYEQDNSWSSAPVDTEVVQNMGKKFVSWFYTVWKAEHRLFSKQKDGKFGPQHFWPDCKASIHITKNDISDKIELNNNQGVANCFLKMLIQDNLILEPNTTCGIKTKMDIFGVVTIAVSGTLHNLQTCIGVFEQIFVLVQEAGHTGSWKIKRTTLKLQCTNDIPGPELPQHLTQDMAVAEC